jgi:hypothetical protein
MSQLLKKIASLITGAPAPARKANRTLKKLTERQLIQLESELGRDLFGPVPKGHRREFFCLDAHTWVWYEEWIDAETKKKKSITTRYEIHDNGILKSQNGASYSFLDEDELRNLAIATRIYYERVVRNVYRHDPYTGKPLTTAPQAR